MKYFFALNLSGKPYWDEEYVRQNRDALILRNVVISLFYWVAYSVLKASYPDTAWLIVMPALFHAAMIGIVLGRTSND